MRTAFRLTIALSLVVLGVAPVLAQEPAPPQTPAPAEEPAAEIPIFTGSFGAGLSMTRGNADTTMFNVSFGATYDPGTFGVVKAEGLYLRGTTDGEDTADRMFFLARYERALTTRAFAFGQGQFIRDAFKGIDYLIAPTAGAGYKIIDSDTIQFLADTSFGIVMEKNPKHDVKTAPAWTVGEKIQYTVSEVATLTQSAQAIWKLNDFGDTLYTVSIGLATSITEKSQLKAELLDTYKTNPPTKTDANDVALLVSFIFKF